MYCYNKRPLSLVSSILYSNYDKGNIPYMKTHEIKTNKHHYTRSLLSLPFHQMPLIFKEP